MNKFYRGLSGLVQMMAAVAEAGQGDPPSLDDQVMFRDQKGETHTMAKEEFLRTHTALGDNMEELPKVEPEKAEEPVGAVSDEHPREALKARNFSWTNEKGEPKVATRK